MNNEQPPFGPNQPIQTDFRRTAAANSKSNRLLIVLVVILMFIAGAGVTYGITKKPAVGQATQTTTAVQKNAYSNQVASAVSNDWHTVAYGSAAVNSKPITKLAFPNNYQAIAYDNGNDSLRSIFGDNNGTFTYHGGVWKLGNPDEGAGMQWGNIEIDGIGPDWSTRNGYATYGGSNFDDVAGSPDAAENVNGYNFYTAKQKKASLATLISDTATCAKDSTKGFSISNTFNICYKPELIRQAEGSYDPHITLNGYASVNGTPYVLFGYIEVRSGFEGKSDAELDKAGDAFSAGNIPTATQKNIDAIINALKHSTFTVQ